MFGFDGGKKRRTRKGKKSGSKKSRGVKKTRRASRGKNAFFKIMLDAKKKNLPSFKYNGKTYHRKQKKHLVYYKA